MNKNEKTKCYLSPMLDALAAQSLGVCVEEPLQEEQLQEACQDADRALRHGPPRHVVEVREQEIVIRSSPHSGKVVEPPHLVNMSLQLLGALLGKMRRLSQGFYNTDWNEKTNLFPKDIPETFVQIDLTENLPSLFDTSMLDRVLLRILYPSSVSFLASSKPS